MGTTPGVRIVPEPRPPAIPVLRCAYCGRLYPSEKPEHCVGCGAPLQGKSTKEQYEEAFYRNAALPSIIIGSALSRSMWEKPRSPDVILPDVGIPELLGYVESEPSHTERWITFGIMSTGVLGFTLFIMHMAGIL